MHSSLCRYGGNDTSLLMQYKWSENATEAHIENLQRSADDWPLHTSDAEMAVLDDIHEASHAL